MNKLLMLFVILCAVWISAPAQFTLDTNKVTSTAYNPSLSDMEYAYFQLWEATAVKDTILMLRPGQSITVLADSVCEFTLDSIKSAGINRISWYTMEVGGRIKGKFALPYTVTHNPFISFNNEPLFAWTKSIEVYNIWYQLQVATDSLFTDIVINDSAIVDTFTYSNGRLKNMMTYYTRVRAITSTGSNIWSHFHKFMTYGGFRMVVGTRFLIIEPILITNIPNPANRQVQLRVRLHKIPKTLYYKQFIP